METLPENHAAALDQAIVLALGGNLTGDFPSLEALLEAAIAELPRAGMRLVRRSGWWRSAAWPDPGQPDYLNAVIVVETALTARQILAAIHDIERQFGRRRAAPNAARTLDIDLIAHGREAIDEPGLTVPHPRAHERLFVVGPLAQIAPDWRHPTTGKTAAELAATAAVGRDARPV